jgi:hypothetical protein
MQHKKELKINPYIYTQLFFNEELRTHIREKTVSLIHDTEKIGYLHAKE